MWAIDQSISSNYQYTSPWANILKYFDGVIHLIKMFLNVDIINYLCWIIVILFCFKDEWKDIDIDICYAVFAMNINTRIGDIIYDTRDKVY